MSRDGQRMEKAFTSPKKKCCIAPSALDNTFTLWVPGIEVAGSVDGVDDGTGRNDDAAVHVVGDPKVLGKRKRYQSSVHYYPILTDYAS